jgi:hypothetical protein
MSEHRPLRARKAEAASATVEVASQQPRRIIEEEAEAALGIVFGFEAGYVSDPYPTIL